LNRIDFLTLADIKIPEVLLSVEDLNDRSDRTLLYGKTFDGNIYHVYLEDGKIHAINYNDREEQPKLYIVNIANNQDYIPKEMFLSPEKSDFEFCKLLKERGIGLPVSSWKEIAEKQICYGKVLSEHN